MKHSMHNNFSAQTTFHLHALPSGWSCIRTIFPPLRFLLFSNDLPDAFLDNVRGVTATYAALSKNDKERSLHLTIRISLIHRMLLLQNFLHICFDSRI